MSLRQAIKILMLSPVYFRLDLKARKELLNDFLVRYGSGPMSMKDCRANSSLSE